MADEDRRGGLLSTTGRSADLIRAIEQPFDADNLDHVDACRRLWHTAWPEVSFAGLIHGGWTRFGFPTGDLTKELTCISLVHHLLNLATFAPALFVSALEADCPLSAASSAVCLLLRGFLRLHPPGTVLQPIGGCGQVASDETRRRFFSWDESRRVTRPSLGWPHAHSTSQLRAPSRADSALVACPFPHSAFRAATGPMPSTRCISSSPCTCCQPGGSSITSSWHSWTFRRLSSRATACRKCRLGGGATASLALWDTKASAPNWYPPWGEPTHYVWGSHSYPSAATRSDPSGSTWRCRRRCRQRVPASLISRHSTCACT